MNETRKSHHNFASKLIDLKGIFLGMSAVTRINEIFSDIERNTRHNLKQNNELVNKRVKSEHNAIIEQENGIKKKFPNKNFNDDGNKKNHIYPSIVKRRKNEFDGRQILTNKNHFHLHFNYIIIFRLTFVLHSSSAQKEKLFYFVSFSFRFFLFRCLLFGFKVKK